MTWYDTTEPKSHVNPASYEHRSDAMTLHDRRNEAIPRGSRVLLRMTRRARDSARENPPAPELSGRIRDKRAASTRRSDRAAVTSLVVE